MYTQVERAKSTSLKQTGAFLLLLMRRMEQKRLACAERVSCLQHVANVCHRIIFERCAASLDMRTQSRSLQKDDRKRIRTSLECIYDRAKQAPYSCVRLLCSKVVI